MRVIVTTVTVPTPGTRVQVSNTTDEVRVIRFHARSGNAGNTYAGTITVSSTNGEEMLPDGSYKLQFDEGQDRHSVRLSVFYIDAAKEGDQVDVTAIVNP